MILDHRNALILQRKFFLLTVKTRPTIRQISSLLISKGKLRALDFLRFQRLSLSIGQFSLSAVIKGPKRSLEKKTVRHYHAEARTSA